MESAGLWKSLKFEALTVLDKELVQIERKDSDHVMRKFAQCSAVRYEGIRSVTSVTGGLQVTSHSNQQR